MKNKIQRHLYIEPWVNKQHENDAYDLGLRPGSYMTMLLTQKAHESRINKEENKSKVEKV